METKNISGKKILITGASGYIGHHLCRKLCTMKSEVHAISRTLHTINENCPRWWHGDLTDIATVRNILNTVKPDLVFHLSGLASGGRDLELILPTFHSNLTTTVNLLTAATEIGGCRIILAGSLEEPDSGDELPSSPYAASKWFSTIYGRMFYNLYKIPIVFLRVFMVYGPGKQNHRKLLPYVITSLLKGQIPKLSSGERQIDWIYIDDVIDGFIAAAVSPNIEGITIDLGSGILISIKTLVEKIADMIKPEGKISFGTVPDRPMEQVRVAHIDETSARIDWKPVISLEKGLGYTITWFREQMQKDEKDSLLLKCPS
ncbi:MAG: NAD(P)-dependent oxidoreductase [Planctomycetia bacterium]|nr:NAD(P)-dependent oxidoreductase [Candidatus Brocadia sp.]QOJ06503.1 MAG: NAD(P)-dependent oxidoreductase [Planctomycetia bacterium]TVL95245.1 MAG: NAD-dependent dehydratase [Candidatus Brocadia sp. BL1]HQU31696.1 NAD(P)-dependent oxidoreductase [Candidatus Brocadia sapporoensis]